VDDLVDSHSIARADDQVSPATIFPPTADHSSCALNFLVVFYFRLDFHELKGPCSSYRQQSSLRVDPNHITTVNSLQLMYDLVDFDLRQNEPHLETDRACCSSVVYKTQARTHTLVAGQLSNSTYFRV
jgi:hypothetical protein